MAENDVKIYTSASEINKQSSAELTKAFESITLNRANGNLSKARLLGQRLATITPSTDLEDDNEMTIELREHLAPRYLSQDILYQIKVLMVFACEAVIQLDIQSVELAATAINSLHDSLKKNSPGFYANISDGAAFTFYYLAVKKGGDLSDNIGDAFAMLCCVKNKEGFIAAGKTVWNMSVDVIEKAIAEFGFMQ